MRDEKRRSSNVNVSCQAAFAARKSRNLMDGKNGLSKLDLCLRLALAIRANYPFNQPACEYYGIKTQHWLVTFKTCRKLALFGRSVSRSWF